MASRVSIQNKSGRTYDFGPFRLDEGEQSLLCDGQAVQLPPKVFDTLLMLVKNRGHLIEKEELMQALWPDSFVESANLNRNISTLRRVLGDDPATPAYIETVPKRGYRFIAEVKEVSTLKTRTTPSERPALELISSDPIAEEKESDSAISESSTATSVRARRRMTARAWAFAGVAVLLLGALIYFGVMARPARTTSPSQIKSLAVLPFYTLGETRRDEYLGLKLADALITRLGSSRKIIVRPTSAVLKYNDQITEPLAAGRALSVDAVLEGSLQETDDRIRVTVRLLSMKENEPPLWTGSIDGVANNLLEIQDSIARQVSEKLSLALDSEAGVGTKNSRAFDLYTEGRILFNQRDWKAETRFRQAVEEDPNFAPAYAGLADTLTLKGQRENVEALIYRAVSLDPDLGEAYASLGFLRMFTHWKWQEAEEHFKRAIELRPAYATSYLWYATLLSITGRPEEARQMLDRGLEIDPTSHNLIADLGEWHYFNREYDKAIEECHRALDILPEYFFALGTICRAYEKKGDFEKFIEYQVRHGMEYSKRRTGLSSRESARELIQQYGGWKGYHQHRLAGLKSQPRTQNQEVAMARSYLALGDKKRTLDCLEKARVSNSFWMAFTGVDPVFDDLREEPRYQEILRKMGLTRWLQ